MELIYDVVRLSFSCQFDRDLRVDMFFDKDRATKKGGIGFEIED